MFSHNTHKSALPSENRSSKSFDWLREPWNHVSIGKPRATWQFTSGQLAKMGMVGVYTDVKTHRPEYRMITTI